MKKHQVDELFRKKLDDWETKPSDALWQRIEAQQKKQSKTPKAWYWSIAAGLSLAMLAGYAVWQTRSVPGSSQEEVAVRQTTPAREIPTAPPSTSLPTESLQQSVTVQAPVVATRTASENTSHSQGHPAVAPLPAKSSEVQIAEPEVIKAERDVQLAKVEEKRPAALQEDLNLKIQQALEGKVNQPALSKAAAAEDNETGVVFVVHVDQPDQLPDPEKKKSSRLARIVRQLKNAKQGEKVEWDEVGFNPAQIIAKADESIRHEEEKVTRQYRTLKNKIKL